MRFVFKTAKKEFSFHVLMSSGACFLDFSIWNIIQLRPSFWAIFTAEKIINAVDPTVTKLEAAAVAWLELVRDDELGTS